MLATLLVAGRSEAAALVKGTFFRGVSLHSAGTASSSVTQLFSREISVNVGGMTRRPIGELFSREVSVMVTESTQLSVRQLFSREVSVNAGGLTTRPIGELFSREVSTLVTNPPPSGSKPFADLAVASVTAPPLAYPGRSIRIGWRVMNRGATATTWFDGSATTSWQDRVVLSRSSRENDPANLVLAEIGRRGVLAPGESYDTNVTVTLPPEWVGDFRVYVVADAAGAVYQDPDTESDVGEAPTPLSIRFVVPWAEQSIDEGRALAAAFVPSVSDVPPGRLRFEALAPPGGLTVDPASGLVQWVPSEAQGPGTYLVGVRIADPAVKDAIETNQFRLTVREVNSRPVMTPVPDQVVAPGKPWALPIVAADLDLPANQLSFVMVTGPSGMTVDASGRVAWVPAAELVGSSPSVVVRVQDDGLPPLADEVAFRVSVSDSNGRLAIIRPPQPTPLVLEKPLVLTVEAVGNGLLRYQWRLNGNDVPGATAATLSVSRAMLSDAGLYSVVVRDDSDSLESPSALVLAELPTLALADRFADRATFASRQFTGTTTHLTATRELGEPLHAGKPGTNSLWMTWRAPATGVATFRTVGSSFDTLLAVYTGTVLSNLVAVAGNDDRDAFLTSEVRFNATEGVDYQIAVDGYAGAGGVLVVGWSLAEAAPPLPTIAAQPQGRVLVLGETGRLQVQTPTPGVVYQWSRDGTDLPGQTRATLDVVGERDAVGSYRVRVTDPAGSAFVTSEEALIEVVDRALAAGARLSADKLADLFLEDGPAAAATAVGLQGGARLAAPVSQGLPGSGTQVTANTVSTHSQDDPLIPGLPLHATRWFRMRFSLLSEGPATVKLTTSGSDIDTLVAVFTNRESLKLLSRQVVKRGAAGDGDGDVYVSVVRGVDYLVLVDGVEGARGRIELKWATRSASGEETETPPLALLRNGRFRVQIVVPAGSYEWSESPGLETWQKLWVTNISHGLFEYELPDPPIEPTRFFRLAPVH